MADIEIEIDSSYDGRDTDRARDDLQGVGDEARRTGEKLKGAGQAADVNAAALKRLGEQAKAVRAEQQRLTAEFAHGNDEALKGLSAQERKLRDIETQTKRLTKTEQERAKSLRESFGGGDSRRGGGGVGGLIGGAAGAAGGAGKAGGGLLGAIPTSPLDLAMIGLLFQAMMPALPMAGGLAVAAGGLGAIGGGIGVGVAGAIADDPEIYEGKWVGVIERISRRWQEASGDFGGPILRSLDKIEETADKIPLENILKNSAKFVDPLMTGLSAVVVGAGNAVDKIISKAGPYINELSEELPELGNDIENIGDMLADASAGGAQAMGDLLDVIGFVSTGLAGLAGSLASYYEAWREMDPTAFQDFWAGIIGGDAATTMATAIRDFIIQPLDEAEEQANQTKAAMDALFDTQMTADEANLAFKESWTALKEELKDGKRTLDDTTEAGQQNRRSILEHIQALEAQRQANIAAGQDQATANAKFYEGVAAVRALLTQLGYAPGEIDKVIAKWLELYRLPDIRKSYTLYANYEGFAANMEATAGKRGQSRGNNAAGGPAEAWSQQRGTWMNEFGWEAVRLPDGSLTLPSSNTAIEMDRLMGGGGGGSGGTRVEVAFRNDTWLGALLLQAQQRGDVQILTSSLVDA